MQLLICVSYQLAQNQLKVVHDSVSTITVNIYLFMIKKSFKSSQSVLIDMLLGVLYHLRIILCLTIEIITSPMDIIDAAESPKISPAVPPMSDKNSKFVYSGYSCSVSSSRSV